MPPLPAEARTLRGGALISKVLWGMVPSIVLIFLVLGTIFLGLATPTEAGAMGAVGAIVLAMAHGRYTNKRMWEAMTSTMRITAMVVFILIGATVFSLVFQGVNGGRWIEHILGSLPGGVVGYLIFVNIFIFFIAFFLDFFEIVFIVVPMLVPAMHALGINLDLVRAAALREHADLVHAPALRFRAVLPARHRAEGGADQGHLLGLSPVDCIATRAGRHHDLLARDRNLLGDGSAAARPGGGGAGSSRGWACPTPGRPRPAAGARIWI